MPDLEAFKKASMEFWDDVAAMSPEANQGIQIVKGWLTDRGYLQ
jgi:hypothetical protein